MMNAGRRVDAPVSHLAAAELLWPVLVAVIVVVLGFAAVGLYSLRSGTGDQRIPASIGGLRLTASQTGEAAVAEMSTMHQADIQIRDGWVGRYERGAAVYVGEAESETGADLLVREMTRRIIESANAMFTHEAEQRIAGVLTHVVKSGDQRHYYYARGREVIWITAPAGIVPGGFLADALAVLSG